MATIRSSRCRVTRLLILAGMVSFLFMLAGMLSGPMAWAGKINASSFSGVAIEGYDPVAYFTDGMAVEGESSFSYQWEGVTWRFASSANRDLFIADPQKYAPQYGGYCAWAVSRGYTASIDPEAWRVVDGKLYLNYSKGVQARWVRDIPGNIRLGDQNWPEIKAGL